MLSATAVLEALGVDSASINPYSPEALSLIYTTYVQTVPFNSVPLFAGEHVDAQLDVALLSKKLVANRIGGVCFEHAVVLCHCLSQLGFDARLMGGEVWPPPPRPPVWTPPNSHATLLVSFPPPATATSARGAAAGNAEAAAGEAAEHQAGLQASGGGGGAKYVLDMGYPLRPLEPLRLVAGVEQWQRDGRGYRLEWDEEGARGAWSLHMCLQGKWVLQHRFWPDAQRAAADFTGPAAGLTANPESPWVRGFILGMCSISSRAAVLVSAAEGGEGGNEDGGAMPVHVTLAYGVWAGSGVPEGHVKYVVRKQQQACQAGSAVAATPAASDPVRPPVVHTELLLPLHSPEVARLMREVFRSTYQLPPPQAQVQLPSAAAVATAPSP